MTCRGHLAGLKLMHAHSALECKMLTRLVGAWVCQQEVGKVLEHGYLNWQLIRGWRLLLEFLPA